MWASEPATPFQYAGKHGIRQHGPFRGPVARLQLHRRGLRDRIRGKEFGGARLSLTGESKQISPRSTCTWSAAQRNSRTEHFRRLRDPDAILWKMSRRRRHPHADREGREIRLTIVGELATRSLQASTRARTVVCSANAGLAGEMRTALYGGSFNASHHGHLILAREAMEQLGLDGVVFIPAAQSPFKLDRTPAPANACQPWCARRWLTSLSSECDGFEKLEKTGPRAYSGRPSRLGAAEASGNNFSTSSDEDNVSELPLWRRFEECARDGAVRCFCAVMAQRARGTSFRAWNRRVDIWASRGAQARCGRPQHPLSRARSGARNNRSAPPSCREAINSETLRRLCAASSPTRKRRYAAPCSICAGLSVSFYRFLCLA